MPKSEAVASETPLTRERLVEVAAQIVAEEGIECLSMRRLAAACGVSSMASYRHIASKEDLLRALANKYLDEVDYPQPDSLAWDDYLREVFRSVREVLLRHPELVEITARQRVNGLGGYRGAEVALGALREAGLTKSDAVAAFTTLYGYTIGFVQREIPRPGRNTQLAERLAAIAELPADEFPQVRSSVEEFLYSDTEQQFNRGLDFIVRGIGASAR